MVQANFNDWHNNSSFWNINVDYILSYFINFCNNLSLFIIFMFTFFIEASSCNNSQGEKHNEMKVSSIAETKIQTNDSPFDVENGVLKKYHWQKCEETENEKAFITRNMIWVNLEQERNYNDLVLVKIERR